MHTTVTLASWQHPENHVFWSVHRDTKLKSIIRSSHLSPLKGVGCVFSFMSRSLYKGPYVYEKLLKKIAAHKPADAVVFKTWARDSVISPEMVGFIFGVHNGNKHIDVLVTEDMVGHRFGEFSPTKTFRRHGGKMQKDLDVKKKEAEVAAAKAAKSASTTKK